ncbi:hypothetical protein PVAG01_06709 [Phlyctema vagabunda]|uniref:Tetratricopeptide repeat protein n=1 Tax=Phlyctema vagabunda TaxID=108571 RepID=A0ABR4PGV8_9HELO
MATRNKPSRLEEDGMGPMERGRRRYQMKDFEGALKAFSEAIKTSTGHMLLTALDHRAAANEKLDQLQAALRDSKQMIELKPEISQASLTRGK